MQLRSWALTDVGRARKHNEDGWLIDEQVGLYAVADGMGGHAAGEVASAHVLRCLQEQLTTAISLTEEFERNPSRVLEREILIEVERAVNTASSEIYSMAQRDKRRHGMGTTLSMLLFAGRKAFMAHVGDSRIYLRRSGQVHQLSEDHSYLWEQVKRGVMTEEEAKNSPFSNVITRAVGITEQVQVDTLIIEVLPGDIFLACSDGLHGYIETTDEMLEIISTTAPAEVPKRMVGLANARGGKDNITVVLIQSPGSNKEGLEHDVAHSLEVLRTIPVFRHLSFPELMKVINVSEVVYYDEGDVIIKEGTAAEEFYVLLSGEVEVSRSGKVLTTLSGGVHFGEMALVDQTPRSATVTALRKIKASMLSRSAFYQLVRSEPALSVKLLWCFVQMLSHRLRATNEALLEAKGAVPRLPFPGAQPPSNPME